MRQGQGDTFNFLAYKKKVSVRRHTNHHFKRNGDGHLSDHLKSLQSSLETSFFLNGHSWGFYFFFHN